MKKISRELVIEIDIHGCIKDISSNSYHILGYEENEMLGRTLWDFSETKGLLGNKRKIMESNTQMRFISKDNKIINFDVEIGTSEESICMSMIKIKEEIASQNIKSYFESMMDNSKDVIYRLEIKPELRFTYINKTVSSITGVNIDKVINNPFEILELIHPEDREYMKLKVNGELNYSKPLSFRIKDKDRRYLWLEDKMHPIYEGNELVAIEGICRDVHERKELEQKLEVLSEYDCLTGLKNRRSFERKISILNAVNTKVGVIVYDLDNLKHINDTLGHFEGDNIIKEFSNLLSSYFGYSPDISRIGGDEFVVILKDLSEKEAMKIFYGFDDVLKKYNRENEMKLETSRGISYSQNSRGIIREIFKIADNNMYEDKKSKKHKKCIKSQDGIEIVQDIIDENLSIESEIFASTMLNLK